MKNIGYVMLLTAMLAICGCSGDKSKTLTFETVNTEKTVSISGEEDAPKCSVHLTLAAVPEDQGERAANVNGTLAQQLLEIETTSLKLAADSFATIYTESYRRNMGPLYREDSSDPDKRAWYEYHYYVTGDASPGKKGVTVYTATVDYYEGGAHGIIQHIVMNFDNKTGKQLTLADVFAPGYEQKLTEMLSEKLMEQTGTSKLDELRQQGYLYVMDMFATENFALGKDGITFIYNPYEIAPYDKGMIELVIDYEQCNEILQSAD